MSAVTQKGKTVKPKVPKRINEAETRGCTTASIAPETEQPYTVAAAERLSIEKTFIDFMMLRRKLVVV
jgi:hypothetical protein